MKKIDCPWVSDELSKLLDKLDWEAIAAEGLTKGTYNPKRNAVQHVSGFSSNQSQYRVKTGEEMGHTKPVFQTSVPLNPESLMTKTNVILSEMADILFENIRTPGGAEFYGDTARHQQKWAGSKAAFNHQKAKFEALSISIQTADTPLVI